MMNCYCCSEKNFEDCCEPFIKGVSKPATAEELMRSRYSAYAISDVEYILRSTHSHTRKYFKRDEIETWAKSSDWEKLEILSTTDGAAKDRKGFVEFKAYYTNEKGEPVVHHELSEFRKELGKWFFYDGKGQ
jgi:SEC-C motif-containing protein